MKKLLIAAALTIFANVSFAGSLNHELAAKCAQHDSSSEQWTYIQEER